MPEVILESSGQRLNCPPGSTLLQALRHAGVLVDAPCNGAGTCAACTVRLEGASLPVPTAREEELLSPDELASGLRLACQCVPVGDVTILHIAHRISDDVDVELLIPASEHAGLCADDSQLGLAVDIGTTTIACELVDMKAGTSLARASCTNAQTAFGLDLLSRITHEVEHPAHAAEELQQAVVASLNRAIERLFQEVEAPLEALGEVVVAANCTMVHLLLGADARGLGAFPFAPAFLEPKDVPAQSIGLHAAPGAHLHCLGHAAPYLGADVVAGAYACGLHEKPGTVLFIDIGTNGELLLAHKGSLLACACAAGPALEAMNITRGMRAVPGAVDEACSTQAGLKLSVIGGGAPLGLCGSGVIAVARELLASGIMAPSGVLTGPEDFAEGDWRRACLRLARSGAYEVVLAAGDTEAAELVFTQTDARNLQLAKGAILAGIHCLLAAAGIGSDDIEQVLVAGQFGSHVAPRSLVDVGILPPGLEGRIAFAGNTSLAGALRALVDVDARSQMAQLARRIAYIELSTLDRFQKQFVQDLAFPSPARS